MGRSIAEPWVFMLPDGDKGYIITAITNTEERWGDIYMARLGPEESDQKETGPPVIKVYLNEKDLPFDVPPVIEGGRILVPLRFIGESLGADVQWEEETRC